MDISDGELFANDVEMSAEMSDILSLGNGGLFANDVVMSAETSDIPLPRETEADGGSNAKRQLQQLLELSFREAEAYIHLPRNLAVFGKLEKSRSSKLLLPAWQRNRSQARL